MGIMWQDSVTNREVLDRAGTASVKTMMQKNHLHWAGHGVHIYEGLHLPKQIIYGQLCTGKKYQG